jgi:hypothetical protein
MEILVFKTNLDSPKAVQEIAFPLNALARIERWNVDLADAEKILRVQAHAVPPEQIIQLVNSQGFMCEELQD